MAPLSQDSGRQNLVTPGTALCRGQRHQGSQEWPPSQMLTCSSGLALKGGVQEGPRHTGHDWLPQVQPSPEQDSWNRTATLPNATDHFLQAHSVPCCRTVTPLPACLCWATHSPFPRSLRTSTKTTYSSCISSPTCITSGLKANTHLKGRCPCPRVHSPPAEPWSPS